MIMHAAQSYDRCGLHPDWWQRRRGLGQAFPQNPTLQCAPGDLVSVTSCIDPNTGAAIPPMGIDAGQWQIYLNAGPNNYQAPASNGGTVAIGGKTPISTAPKTPPAQQLYNPAGRGPLVQTTPPPPPPPPPGHPPPTATKPVVVNPAPTQPVDTILGTSTPLSAVSTANGTTTTGGVLSDLTTNDLIPGIPNWVLLAGGVAAIAFIVSKGK